MIIIAGWSVKGHVAVQTGRVGIQLTVPSGLQKVDAALLFAAGAPGWVVGAGVLALVIVWGETLGAEITGPEESL